MSAGILVIGAHVSLAVAVVALFPAVSVKAATSDRNRPGDQVPVFTGTSLCPTPDAVFHQLGGLIGEDATRGVNAARSGALVVQVVDLGATYRVIVGGRERTYRDDRRDCAERARIAALFVALAFAPIPASAAAPGAGVTPSSPRESPDVVVAVSAPSDVPDEDRPPFVAALELGAAVAAGVGSDPRVVEPGVGMGLSIGRGWLALALGAVGFAPATTTAGGLRVRQWRLPFEVGARARGQWGSVSPYAELGLSAALVSERALDLATSTSDRAFELGATGVVGMRFSTVARFAPYISVRADVVPRPTAISALPRGVVGHTPHVWIGAMAGASIGF